MLLRTLPDFVAAHAEVQQSFNSRWGRENCIVWGRARRSKFGPRMHSLSIRAAWGGEERCQFDGRTVAVDDDSFLILNNGRVCTTQIDAPQPVESFAIYFGPALVEHTYGAMTLSIEKALERGDAVVERSAEFLESLQPHDKLVSPVLRFIRLHVLRGVDDEAWYDEQLNFLLERMLTHRGGVIERIDALQLIRTSTRREIYRRISLSIWIRWARPHACRSITSCGCSRAFTASHRTNTCCANAPRRPCGCCRLRRWTCARSRRVSASRSAMHCCARCGAGRGCRRARFVGPNRSPRSGHKSSIKKKGGGVAAPPPLSPYPLLLQ